MQEIKIKKISALSFMKLCGLIAFIYVFVTEEASLVFFVLQKIPTGSNIEAMFNMAKISYSAGFYVFMISIISGVLLFLVGFILVIPFNLFLKFIDGISIKGEFKEPQLLDYKWERFMEDKWLDRKIKES